MPTAPKLPSEPVKRPDPAAFLRRHPKLGRRAAVGAIAAGVALCAAWSVSTLAAAHDGTRASRPDGTSHSRFDPAAVFGSASPTGAPAAPPAPAKVLAGPPTHVRTPAPDTRPVINSLAAGGIPSVALNAYRVAAARMANAEPGCGIDWALLAGIGREESDHGRFGGAVLHANGVSTPPIIGPALDGTHWDYIPAPPNGMALDGDPTYAHALGPMQFIPSTWAIYGADADGDGTANVFDINDAALGAARLLCAAGGDLRTHAGQVRAVLAYNHSDEYLAQVLALADAYRHGVPVTGIPVGITTGPLPPIASTGPIPPANPAAPPAGRGPTAKSAGAHRHRTQHPGRRSQHTGGGTRHTGGQSGSGNMGNSNTQPKPDASPTAGTPKPAPKPTLPKLPKLPKPSTSLPAPLPTKLPTPSPSKSCTVLQHLLGKC